MTTVMTHEPSTDEPDRQGVAARLLVPGFWGAVSIIAMWLAVMFAASSAATWSSATTRGAARRSSHQRCSWGCSPSSARRPSLSASSAAGTPAERFRDGSAIRAMRQPGGQVRPRWSGPVLSAVFRGDDDDRAARVVADLGADRPISSRANPPAPRDPTTIMSASRTVARSRHAGPPSSSRERNWRIWGKTATSPSWNGSTPRDTTDRSLPAVPSCRA